MPLQGADHLEGEGGLPILSAGEVRVGKLVLGEDRIGRHEELGQRHGQHGAHGDADDLVTELHDAIGAQAPAGRAILLHVAAFAGGDGQDRAAEQAHAGIAQPQRRHDEDRHHEGAGDGIEVRDAQRDAVDQDKKEAESPTATTRKNTG